MRKWLLVTVILSCAGEAGASILTFTDRTAFLSALNGTTYENDFQGISTNAFGSPQAFSGNGFGYNVSAINGLIGIDIGGDISIAAVSGNMALTFSNFSGGVNALGGYFFFDANTQVSATGAGTLTANNGVDPAAVLQVTAPSSLTGFFGFISTSGSLTSVSLLRTSASGFPDADDVIVGTASSVPEPGTMVLFGAGLGLVVLRRARLRR